MRANRRGVVLLLDHIERLSRARDIFTLLRALYQQFQADADQDGGDGAAGPAFVFVLASAQSLLGEAYLNGTGVRRDCRTAAAWLRKAAVQGDATARTLLGTIAPGGAGN